MLFLLCFCAPTFGMHRAAGAAPSLPSSILALLGQGKFIQVVSGWNIPTRMMGHARRWEWMLHKMAMAATLALSSSWAPHP